MRRADTEHVSNAWFSDVETHLEEKFKEVASVVGARFRAQRIDESHYGNQKEHFCTLVCLIAQGEKETFLQKISLQQIDQEFPYKRIQSNRYRNLLLNLRAHLGLLEQSTDVSIENWTKLRGECRHYLSLLHDAQSKSEPNAFVNAHLGRLHSVEIIIPKPKAPPSCRR